MKAYLVVALVWVGSQHGQSRATGDCNGARTGGIPLQQSISVPSEDIILNTMTHSYFDIFCCAHVTTKACRGDVPCTQSIAAPDHASLLFLTCIRSVAEVREHVRSMSVSANACPLTSRSAQVLRRRLARQRRVDLVAG